MSQVFRLVTNEQIRHFCCGLWSIFQVDRTIRQICRRSKVAVHFDTAFDSQSSRSATGLLVRNEEGEILALKAVIHSEIATPFTAKAHARLQAIKLGIFVGFNKMDVVGDSKIVIRKCQSTETDKLAIGAIIRDIQSIKHRFQEIEFHFVPKAENMITHVITKEALKRRESYYPVRGISESIHQELQIYRPRHPD